MTSEVVCSRDMSEHIQRAISERDYECLVFRSADYDPTRRCNRLWITARNMTWAIAKIEALGVPGEHYMILSKDAYNSRFEDAP